MIHLLWPTVRPAVSVETLKHWKSTAVKPEEVRIRIAVNTQEHADQLQGWGELMIVGNRRRGAAYPAYRLFSSLEADPKDIVLLAGDDIFAPPSWDEWLVQQLGGLEDAIMVNDGGQYGACIGQPTMTYACLLKMNKMVIHPSYNHFFGDAEFYHNVTQLGLARDLRGSPGPIFEHRNWAWGKRAKDEHDHATCALWNQDEANFNSRMSLPLEERLKVDERTIFPQEASGNSPG